MGIIECFRRVFRVPSVEENYNEDIKNLKKEVIETVTPMVYNGEMYLSYKGKPIFKAEDLKKNIVDAIEDSRGLILSYSLSQIKGKYGIG